MQLGKDFIKALKQIEQEKGLSSEIIISSLEAALVSSYRKHRWGNQNVEVHIEPETARWFFTRSSKSAKRSRTRIPR